MILDRTTLLIINLTLASFFTFTWLLSAFLFKSSPATSINFALSNLSFGSFLFFYVGRTYWSNHLVYILSDIFVILGCLLLKRATEVFTEKKARDIELLILFGLATVLDIYARFEDLKVFAIVVTCGFSLYGLVITWINSYQFMVKSFRKVYSVTTTSPIFIMSVLVALRIIVTLYSLSNTDLRAKSEFNTGFLVIMMLCLLGFNSTAIGLVISKMINKIRILSEKDPLTDAYNRRYLNMVAEEEITRVRKNHYPLSVVLLDIDHFKRVNDVYGHAAGDMALIGCVDIIKRNIRSTDHVGRLGGEEFCILLPKTSLDSARIIAERIRSNIQTEPILWEDKSISITASFGITCFNSTIENEWSNLLNKADIAMYQAKNNGRNQIVSNE